MEAVAFGPTYDLYEALEGSNPSWFAPFNNFTRTNTLADFVGDPLYQESLAELEAAFIADYNVDVSGA